MQNSSKSDLYANLPDDLLEEILTDAPELANKIIPLFQQLEEQKQSIHNKLEENKFLRNVSELENPTSPSVAAIDGGQAIEKSLGADILMAVGVGVEGLVREDKRRWTGIQHKSWSEVLPHQSESNPKIARGAMTALELLVVADTPHDVVIADGSHQTPVIGINSLTSMSSLDDPLHKKIMLDIVERFQVVNSLKKAMENSNIVYMVKYDSSQDIVQTILNQFSLTVDDKTVMTLTLKPDEFTTPLQVGQTSKTKEVWGNLNISISQKIEDTNEITQLKGKLNQAISMPKSRRIYFTYYKPYEWSPAYRIELKESCARNEFELAKVLKAVKEQVVSPEIQEPYPQYLADMMAKSISGGLDALRAVVQSQIGDNENMLRIITQSYRTY